MVLRRKEGLKWRKIELSHFSKLDFYYPSFRDQNILNTVAGIEEKFVIINFSTRSSGKPNKESETALIDLFEKNVQERPLFKRNDNDLAYVPGIDSNAVRDSQVKNLKNRVIKKLDNTSSPARGRGTFHRQRGRGPRGRNTYRFNPYRSTHNYQSYDNNSNSFGRNRGRGRGRTHRGRPFTRNFSQRFNSNRSYPPQNPSPSKHPKSNSGSF